MPGREVRTQLARPEREREFGRIRRGWLEHGGGRVPTERMMTTPSSRTGAIVNELLQGLPGEDRRRLKKRGFPRWISPMLATLTKEVFSDPAWIYEAKLDGQRSLLFRKGSSIRLMTRNEKDRTSTYPDLREAIAAQETPDTLMDRVATGFRFTEGPAWSREGFLLFSDVPNDKIMKYVPGQKPTVFRENSNGANGNCFDAQGRNRYWVCVRLTFLTAPRPAGFSVASSSSLPNKLLPPLLATAPYFCQVTMTFAPTEARG
jgi:hypothetical protein